MNSRAALHVCEILIVFVRRCDLSFCHNSSRANLRPHHRPALEQAADRRSAGPSAAHQQPAHLDGRLARRPLRGHGECRLRNLRVASTSSRFAVLDTQTGALADFPDRAHRRYAPSRRSTPASPSAATAAISTPAWLRSPIPRATSKATRAAASRSTASLRARSRPERLIPLPVVPLAARAQRPACLKEQRADQGVPYPAAIAVLGAAGHEKLLVAENLSDDVVLARCRDRRDREAIRSFRERRRALDLSHRAGRDQRRKARLRRAVERVGDCGTRSCARQQSRASWRCSSRRVPSRRERIPAPSPFRRTRRRSTWRWPIATPSPP